MSRYYLSITVDTDAPPRSELNRVFALSGVLGVVLFDLDQHHQFHVREVGMWEEHDIPEERMP